MDNINAFSIFTMIVAAFLSGFVLGVEVQAHEEKHDENDKK